MQPHAKHIDVFVRTGVWFVQIANNFGANKEYSQAERDTFRHDPKALVAHAKSIEDQVNGIWGGFYSGTEAQKQIAEFFKQRMREFIKDDRLLEGFTPRFEVGCRRITPGDPYMEAIQRENVDVHFTPVEAATEEGVVGADGLERKVDTVSPRHPRFLPHFGPWRYCENPFPGEEPGEKHRLVRDGLQIYGPSVEAPGNHSTLERVRKCPACKEQCAKERHGTGSVLRRHCSHKTAGNEKKPTGDEWPCKVPALTSSRSSVPPASTSATNLVSPSSAREAST